MSLLLTALVSFSLGAATSYLVLRNNPKVRRALDRTSTSVEDLVRK